MLNLFKSTIFGYIPQLHKTCPICPCSIVPFPGVHHRWTAGLRADGRWKLSIAPANQMISWTQLVERRFYFHEFHGYQSGDFSRKRSSHSQFLAAPSGLSHEFTWVVTTYKILYVHSEKPPLVIIRGMII